ncbi:Threonyl/alanyl tRNA synthetase [Pyrenochaeta sp. MPI-SDFR-AT-0127]|nr:Threonyl/alanyl tRNA synthetase [Pyrenochaeta sp. MPI-SDFR-AT-0127]
MRILYSSRLPHSILICYKTNIVKTTTGNSPSSRSSIKGLHTIPPQGHYNLVASYTMASIPNERTEPLYQKDGQLYKHSSTVTTVQALSDFPQDVQGLFKPPPDAKPYILTTPSTIFHAQGGGQPSDTGTIKSAASTFHVHQVRKIDPAILHMGVFDGSDAKFETGNAPAEQAIDVDKRVLHSRLHTAGHVIGLAINGLVKAGKLPSDIVDGKASHYPSAAFVEFAGLIPGTAKADIQAKVDELVADDLDVKIHFWTEERARSDCTGVLESFKSDEDGVRVVEFGDVGSYPCGGTHVLTLKECGRVVIRGIKRQKGISKVSYEVNDA